MKTESREYYATRERAERTAAENASSPEARKAHADMARAYAKLAERNQQDAERPAASR
jgi:hypothetical protein